MSSFAGFWHIVWLIIRRDRIRIGIWVAVIASLVLLTATSFPGIYQDESERQMRATLIDMPAGAALTGPGHGLNDYTFGAMMANEMFSFTAIFVGLMALLLMVRHTRAEESSGSMELIRAGVAGRHAGLAAAFVVVGGACMLLGGIIGFGLPLLGIESIGWHGSLLFGIALGLIGVAFAAIAAVAAQITEHARGASGIAGAVLATAFALRAAGDMGDGALSWLSPIGWAQATQMYVQDIWWPLILMIMFIALTAVIAFVLNAKRDVGAGIVAPRRGRAVAASSLSSPLGLAIRLHRTAIIWWAIGIGLFGLLYGTLVSEVEEFIASSSFRENLLFAVQGDALIDSFFALIISLLAMACAAFAITSVMRLRSEESSGHLENILATSVGRIKWVFSHVVIALIGSVFVLLVASATLGVSAAFVLDDFSTVLRLVGASLAYIPAIWLVISIAVGIFALAPRFTAAVWIVLAYSMTVGMLGGLLGLPDWANNLSPFSYIPLLPAESLQWVPLIILSAITIVVMALGLSIFRRRDINTV